MSDSQGAAAQALSDGAVADKEAGRLVEAQAKIDEALTLLRHTAKSNPEDATALNNLTVHLSRAVQIAVARDLLEDASAYVDEQFEISQIMSRLPGEQSSADLHAFFGAQCHGDAEVTRGWFQQAVDQYQRAADLARRRLDDDGDSAVWLERLAHALHCIADIERERVPVERAYASYLQIAEVVSRLERVAGDTPTALMARSVCHERLGRIQERCGHLADAADHFRRSYEALQRWDAHADRNDTPTLQHNMAVALVFLAGIELRTGRPSESIRLCAEAMRHARAVDSPDSCAGLGARAICKVLQYQGDALWANGEPLLAKQAHAELYDVSSKWVEKQECVDGIEAHLASLLRMVQAEKAFGDTAKACHYAERALAFALRLHSLVGDTVQSCSAVMFAHKFLGDLGVAEGREHQARASFQKQLWWAERVVESFGESDDSMLWLGEAAERLGDLEKLTGRYTEARRFFKLRQECVERRLSTSGKTAELIREMIFCLQRFGDLALIEGNPGLAMTQFEELRDWSMQLIGVMGDLPDSLRQLAISRMRLGDAHGRLGLLEQAHEHWIAALSIVRRIRAATGDTMEAVRDESVVYSGLAAIERARENGDAARGWYLAQVELLAGLISRTFATPELVRDLAMALHGLSVVHMARMGERALAMDAAKRSVEYLTRVSDQLASWAEDAMNWADVLTGWTMAGLVQLDEVWPLFRELWRGLYSFIDLNRAEVIGRTRGHVDAFLSMWMDLSRLFAPERLPEVLAAKQGRKLLALAAELAVGPHRSEARSNEQVAMQYRALRLRLRHLAIELGNREHNVQRAKEGSGGDEKKLPRGPASGVALDGAQAVRDLYDETQRELEECRAQVAKSAGLEAMPLTGMATEDFRAGLSAGEALLILIELPSALAGSGADGHTETVGVEGDPIFDSGDGVDPSDEGDEILAAQSGSWALLLFGSGHLSMALPGLEHAAFALRDMGHQQAVSKGHRYAPSTDAERPEQLDALAPAPGLTQALWTPLAPHLRGIHTLHVVTHGELHLLALQDGAPAGLQVCHYPGLVFWLLQRRRAAAAEAATTPTARPDAVAQPAVALQAHSPANSEELPPIPFVHAEARALQALWKHVQPIEHDRPLQVALLHLAGHGQAGQGQDAGVLVGPGQTLGLHEVLRSGLKADIVYLSACLVGRTSEDLDGDPLGMLSALFLRGARQIVAPLVPVSDFDAPLLAILFHLALKAQPGGRLDAHRALHEAKAQLRSGEWPAPAEDLVRQAYLPTVQQAIEDVLAQGATGVLEPHNEVGRLMAQWLEPASDFFDVQAAEHGPVAAVFARGGGAAAGAQVALDLLVRNRHRLYLRPGVQALLRYVGVFGVPGPAR